MNKKIIIIVVVILVIVVVAGYLLFGSKILPQSAGNMNQIVNQGVLPSLGENINPMKNKPDINPINTSNPFRSIKTNPFQ